MTINGIWDWASSFSKPLTLETLRNKTLAIDGHIWLYESIRGCQAHNIPDASVFVTFFKRCQLLLEHNVRLIMVFDAIVPNTQVVHVPRLSEVCARKRRRGGYGLRITNQAEKVIDLQAMLKHLGVTVVISKGDGEAQCAKLESSGVTQGTITTDFDYFLFGGRNLYRIQFGSATNSVKHISVVSMESLEAEKKVTRAGLIALAILLGCDYYKDGVTGIGIITGLDILSEFGHVSEEDDDPAVILDRFVSYVKEEVPARSEDSQRKLKLRRKSYAFPEGFPNSDGVHEAVNIYLNPEIVNFGKNGEKLKMEDGMKNVERIIQLLISKCGWTEEKANRELEFSEKRTKIANQKASQKLITDFCYKSTRRRVVKPVVEKCSVEEYLESSKKWFEDRKSTYPNDDLFGKSNNRNPRKRPMRIIATKETNKKKWPVYKVSSSSDDEPCDVIVLDSD